LSLCFPYILHGQPGHVCCCGMKTYQKPYSGSMLCLYNHPCIPSKQLLWQEGGLGGATTRVISGMHQVFLQPTSSEVHTTTTVNMSIPLSATLHYIATAGQGTGGNAIGFPLSAPRPVRTALLTPQASCTNSMTPGLHAGHDHPPDVHVGVVRSCLCICNGISKQHTPGGRVGRALQQKVSRCLGCLLAAWAKFSVALGFKRLTFPAMAVESFEAKAF
jgi:hypothetical protein